MQTLQFDAEAAGKALFDETFQGTLPLYPTWEEQPPAFRSLMASRALTVARAAVALVEVPDEPLPTPHLDAPASTGGPPIPQEA